MNLLDDWGLTLQSDYGKAQRFSLRQILQAVAEDEEARKLIGMAINEAPRVSTIECFTAANIVECGPWNPMDNYEHALNASVEDSEP